MWVKARGVFFIVSQISQPSSLSTFVPAKAGTHTPCRSLVSTVRVGFAWGGISELNSRLWLWGSPRARLCEKSRVFATDGPAVAGAQKSFSGSGGLKRCQQRRYSEDVDDPFEIVAQHAQCQFRFCFSQPPEQEPRVGHQPFHRAKRVFGDFPPVLHPRRIGGRSPGHRLPPILVKIAHDDPPRRLRTFWLHRTPAAPPPPLLFPLLRFGHPLQSPRGARRPP